MSENLDVKKKLIKNIKKLQQSEYLYEKLLEDRNSNLIKLIEDFENNSSNVSFAKFTVDRIKEGLSEKINVINQDLTFVDNELNTIIDILEEMLDK